MGTGGALWMLSGMWRDEPAFVSGLWENTHCGRAQVDMSGHFTARKRPRVWNMASRRLPSQRPRAGRAGSIHARSTRARTCSRLLPRPASRFRRGSSPIHLRRVSSSHTFIEQTTLLQIKCRHRSNAHVQPPCDKFKRHWNGWSASHPSRTALIGGSCALFI